MRNIILHGHLAEKFGERFRLSVETAGEAVRALITNFPQFADVLRNGEYHVVRGEDVDTGISLGEDDVRTFRLGKGDLHIVPVIAGSKRSGLLKIILGVALVGAAFLFSGGALATPILGAASQGGLLSGITWGNLAMMGVALTIAGASQMLADEKGKEEKDESYLFAGPGNSYDQGSPVPLVYGEAIVGSVMVSGGIDIEQLVGPSGNEIGGLDPKDVPTLTFEDFGGQPLDDPDSQEPTEGDNNG